MMKGKGVRCLPALVRRSGVTKLIALLDRKYYGIENFLLNKGYFPVSRHDVYQATFLSVAILRVMDVSIHNNDPGRFSSCHT